MTSTTLPRYAWRSDGDPAGHNDYCAFPTHSQVHYCSAASPEQGPESDAWLADHPDRITKTLAEVCATVDVARSLFTFGPDRLASSDGNVVTFDSVLPDGTVRRFTATVEVAK